MVFFPVLYIRDLEYTIFCGTIHFDIGKFQKVIAVYTGTYSYMSLVSEMRLVRAADADSNNALYHSCSNISSTSQLSTMCVPCQINLMPIVRTSYRMCFTKLFNKD